jgi:uncharacterized protein (DUF433 family)
VNPGSDAAATFYGGKDPRDLPRYSYLDASRATGVPASTIAAWFRGQDYQRKNDVGFFRPVITRPIGASRLSFFNLIEIHVLRWLRRKHAVKLEHIRQAAEVAEHQYNIPKLLLSEELRFAPGALFLERYGALEQLTPLQQLAMRDVLAGSLDRISFVDGLPLDFYPIIRRTASGRHIMLSPSVSFGRAVVRRLGIATHTIADHLNAGDSEAAVMDNFGLEPSELAEAIAYEADVAVA